MVGLVCRSTACNTSRGSKAASVSRPAIPPSHLLNGRACCGCPSCHAGCRGPASSSARSGKNRYSSLLPTTRDASEVSPLCHSPATHDDTLAGPPTQTVGRNERRRQACDASVLFPADRISDAPGSLCWTFKIVDQRASLAGPCSSPGAFNVNAFKVLFGRSNASHGQARTILRGECLCLAWRPRALPSTTSANPPPERAVGLQDGPLAAAPSLARELARGSPVDRLVLERLTAVRRSLTSAPRRRSSPISGLPHSECTASPAGPGVESLRPTRRTGLAFPVWQCHVSSKIESQRHAIPSEASLRNKTIRRGQPPAAWSALRFTAIAFDECRHSFF